MGAFLLTAAVIAMGATAVVTAKRRAHRQWLDRTGGVITGPARGAASKRGRRNTGTVVYGGDPGGASQPSHLIAEGDVYTYPGGDVGISVLRRQPVVLPMAAVFGGSDARTRMRLDFGNISVFISGLVERPGWRRGQRLEAGVLLGYTRPNQTVSILAEQRDRPVDVATFFRENLVNLTSRSSF